MTNHHRPGFSGGAIAALSIVPAAIAFGISFGVLAQAAGLGTLASVVMSATTFGGSAQFAAVSILSEGGAVTAAVLTALVLNARYAPMGLSVAHLFRGSPMKRFFTSQLLVDESWALSRVLDRFDAGRLVGAGVVLYVTWTLSTLIGGLGGRFLGDPRELGMDAALPALFLALLVPQLTSRRSKVAALVGGGVAAALVPVSPPGVPVIAAITGVLAGWREGGDRSDENASPEVRR